MVRPIPRAADISSRSGTPGGGIFSYRQADGPRRESGVTAHHGPESASQTHVRTAAAFIRSTLRSTRRGRTAALLSYLEGLYLDAQIRDPDAPDAPPELVAKVRRAWVLWAEALHLERRLRGAADAAFLAAIR